MNIAIECGEGNGTPLQYSCLEKSNGWRSLEGCSPWGRWGSDKTERLHFHFSLSCVGEGNGNPFQCSCLENPRDGRAWWAAVYGVAQSWTRLKRLSSRSGKETKELYAENCKTLMKEIKDDISRWRDIPCYLVGRIIIVKMIILPMQSTDSMWSLSNYKWHFHRTETNNFTVHMET